MTSRQGPEPLAVAMATTVLLNEAEAEITRLRAHIASVALDGTPAWTARRSAQIIADVTASVADQLRDLAATQTDGSVVL